ncbi:MAG: GIY-YIG nuclease family protein [archaeon]
MPHFVYLLRCRDKSFYCGYTKNLEARVEAHNKGTGARYTRSHRPVKLVYFERKRGIGSAMRRELEIKSFPRKKKIELASGRQIRQKKKKKRKKAD